MKIRPATYLDAAAIKFLMAQKGCKTTTSMLVGQLENLFSGDHHQVFVCESNKDVMGFVAAHFMPQLGADRGSVFISGISVDKGFLDQGVAEALEEYVTRLALAGMYDQIQIAGVDSLFHSPEFYIQQGYQEYWKFFIKKLIYEG